MKDLIELYYISSPSQKEDEMHQHLIQKMCDLGLTVNVDSANNIYGQYGEADTFPCIVAHTDEVHAVKPEDFEVLRYRGNLYGFSESRKDFIGIGADDKNGIWIALKIAKAFIRKKKPIKVAFFPGEECGCIGSSKAELDFFKNCRFVLQCDRKGSSDFITVANGIELCSDDFLTAVYPLLQKYGYKKANGLTTDVYELKHSGLSISVANISCGYYNAHTCREITNIKELRRALELAKRIMEITEVFPHETIIQKKPLDRWTWNMGWGCHYDYGRRTLYADDTRRNLEMRYLLGDIDDDEEF